MKRDIITISDNGAVNVPSNNIMMTDYEIAQLLGVTVPFVRGAIKRLLKTRHVADCGGGIVSGHSIIPEFYGLEVIITVAFQVVSYQSDIFRKWVMQKMMQSNSRSIFIGFNNAKDNIFC